MADKNKQRTSHEVTNRKGCLITKTTDSERDGGDVQRISDCKERGKVRLYGTHGDLGFMEGCGQMHSLAAS